MATTKPRKQHLTARFGYAPMKEVINTVPKGEEASGDYLPGYKDVTCTQCAKRYLGHAKSKLCKVCALTQAQRDNLTGR